MSSEIQNILDNFSDVTGLNCVLVDTNYRPIAESGCISDDFCAAIHTSSKCLDCCLQSDIAAFATVERTHATHIYTCPFGFYQAIVPVIRHGKLAAYLIISIVAQQQPRDIWQQNTLRAVAATDGDFDLSTLYKYLDEVVMYPAKRLATCTDTLAVFAEYIAQRLTASAGQQTLGEAAKAYIDKNLHKKITLAAVSMSLHCSTVTLTEHFKKEFGTTIMQYVLQKRMELAKELLGGTDLPVKEIAYRCGFADVEYFSRCFRDTCGNSPARWRNDI